MQQTWSQRCSVAASKAYSTQVSLSFSDTQLAAVHTSLTWSDA